MSRPEDQMIKSKKLSSPIKCNAIPDGEKNEDIQMTDEQLNKCLRTITVNEELEVKTRETRRLMKNQANYMRMQEHLLQKHSIAETEVMPQVSFVQANYNTNITQAQTQPQTYQTTKIGTNQGMTQQT